MLYTMKQTLHRVQNAAIGPCEVLVERGRPWTVLSNKTFFETNMKSEIQVLIDRCLRALQVFLAYK